MPCESTMRRGTTYDTTSACSAQTRASRRFFEDFFAQQTVYGVQPHPSSEDASLGSTIARDGAAGDCDKDLQGCGKTQVGTLKCNQLDSRPNLGTTFELPSPPPLSLPPPPREVQVLLFRSTVSTRHSLCCRCSFPAPCLAVCCSCRVLRRFLGWSLRSRLCRVLRSYHLSCIFGGCLGLSNPICGAGPRPGALYIPLTRLATLLCFSVPDSTSPVPSLRIAFTLRLLTALRRLVAATLPTLGSFFWSLLRTSRRSSTVVACTLRDLRPRGSQLRVTPAWSCFAVYNPSTGIRCRLLVERKGFASARLSGCRAHGRSMASLGGAWRTCGGPLASCRGVCTPLIGLMLGERIA